ncbi:MAG: hypothetical protein ACKO1J_15300 [Tagaea sp.]
MPADAIRLRIVARDPKLRQEREPREAFWAAARDESDSNESIPALEAKLCRRFGPELREALLRHLAEPLRTLDSELFPGSLRDFERWMFRLMDDPRSLREWYRYQFAEAFTRLMEQRQQVLRDSPSLRRVQERLAAAAGVAFSTKIVGYSSLNLDIVPGSFKQIAAAFENDFDSFRVFLEAFVPVAFAGVFSEASSDRLEFSVTVPTSAEQAFRDAKIEVASHPALVAAVPASAPASGRERAEWLWRLANGSLLVPLLLALLVMYQGMKMLGEIRASQYDALMPVLEHQLKLLEEDRLRLYPDAGTRQQVPPASGQPSGTGR